MRAQALAAALVSLAFGAGCDPRSDGAQPPTDPASVQPQVQLDARLLTLLQRLDPLPAGDAQKVVLSVRGAPIRRGDFERILDLWLPTLDPETALAPLLEAALLNELLPRALALGSLPPGELEAITDALDAGRGPDGRFALPALTSALAPHSAALGDAAELFELQLERKRNAQPLLALAGARLKRAGDQVGPVVTRDGVAVFERAETSGAQPSASEGTAPLQAALWVRAAVLVWRLRGEATPPGEYLRGPELRLHLDSLAAAAIRAKEVHVLDPAYADAIPRWLPKPK